MATELNFYLSNDYIDRLWAIKEQQGKTELTGNEFARELLESVLYQLHPKTVNHEVE